MKNWSAAVALALIGLNIYAAPAQAAPTETPIPVPNTAPATETTRTILVTFDDAQTNPKTAAAAAVSEVAKSVAGVEVASVQPITHTTVAVTLNADLTTAQADRIQAKVEKIRGIDAAEPSVGFYPTVLDTPTDLWNIYQGGGSPYGVNADAAWSTTSGQRADGSSVIVGVVDTGITAHPDLDANVVPGYDFVSDYTSAGDGNGRDADPSDPGDQSEDNYASSWHGTHVAGIIAALNNDIGVVGVAPNAKIEPLRVLGRPVGSSGGGSEADVIAAIRWGSGNWVSGVGTNPNPVNVLNLSLGGSGSCSKAMQSAIDAAVAKGVPVVVAAGNSNVPLYKSTPANCNNVISVMASTQSGTRAWYSNYGTSARAATISAPGGDGVRADGTDGIWSTLNDGTFTVGTPTYEQASGTSMAAPHVAGVIALLKAKFPSWTPAQLAAAIRATATPFPSTAGCTTTACGTGIVNAAGAVSLAGILTKQTAPSISGTFKAGKKLAAHPGVWSPGATSISYQWLRNGKPISKATWSTYKLTKKDRHKKVSVKVSASAPGYLWNSATSAAKKVK